MRRLLFLFLLLLPLLSCSKPMQETHLIGYESGKVRMKFSSLLYSITLPNSKPGYRLETNINYSLGTKERREISRVATIKENFTMYDVKVKRNINGTVTDTNISYRDGKIQVNISVNGKEDVNKTLEKVGPIYSDIPPLLYSKELTKPMTDKVYPVFHEGSQSLRDMVVRYIGPKEFYEDGTKHNALHYQLETISNKGNFDNYYIHPESKKVIKIEAGELTFLPAKE